MKTKVFFSDDGFSWIAIDEKKENEAYVGISPESAKKVREFVFIELPVAGSEIKKGDKYVSLEAIKWSGHIASPLSGKIVEVNESLFDEPGKINRDPLGSWIMKVRISSPKEVSLLKEMKK